MMQGDAPRSIDLKTHRVYPVEGDKLERTTDTVSGHLLCLYMRAVL